MKDTNLQSFAFNYRVSTEIVPVPMAVSPGTNGAGYRGILRTNLHEVRLNFRWPIVPGGVGNNKQTFRTLVGGEMYETNYAPGQSLFFFRPTIYSTNAP